MLQNEKIEEKSTEIPFNNIRKLFNFFENSANAISRNTKITLSNFQINILNNKSQNFSNVENEKNHDFNEKNEIFLTEDKNISFYNSTV